MALPPSESTLPADGDIILLADASVNQKSYVQLDLLLRRVEGEYLEMPGLQLTRDQAQRLWAIDQAACTLVLDALIERRFLVRGPDNRYRRASDGPLPVGRLRQARAALPLPIPARRLG